MSIKLFISYSHVDEQLMGKMRNHLTPLTKTSSLEIWYDRALLPGDKLDETIKQKLDESDIVLFLISSDFLSSYSCYDVELMSVINDKKHKNKIVVPLILRSCAWKETDLQQFTAIPNDGTAITSHENIDEPLHECAKRIKALIDFLTLLPPTSNKKIENSVESIFTVSGYFLEFLDDTEIVFQHKHKDTIGLSDIFVYPDLRVIDDNDDKIDVVINSKELIFNFEKNARTALVIGDEQSGKTALAKQAFKNIYSNGLYPILIECGQLPTKVRIDKILESAISKQYIETNYLDVLNVKDKCILILDDFHKIKLNAKHQRILLEKLSRISSKILVFADSEIQLNEPSYTIFEDHINYEILRFSYLKKAEIISKWNQIGIEESIEEHELQLLNDRSRQHIDSVIKRNVIPSKPIFILTVLQTLESVRPSDYSLTSHGHCYEFLITQSLYRANISRDDLAICINYLSEFAYFIYKRHGYSISEKEYEEFANSYSRNFIIESHEKVLETLISARIVCKHDKLYYFRYKYIYYFYVAKFVAENITEENVQQIISTLCEGLHRAKNANILIFITHHTKNQVIFDEILYHASEIFKAYAPCNLKGEDVAYLQEVIKTIPKLIIEHRDVEDERRKQLENKDMQEGLESSSASEEYSDTQELETDETYSNATLAEINSSIKAVDLIGQIVRNRHGDLTKEQLSKLADASISVGLRFLDFYLEIHESAEDEIIGIITELISEHWSIPNNEIEKSARNMYVRMCYEIIFHVLRRIAFSNGSEKLLGLFDEISKKSPDSPAVMLLNLAIKLEFSNKLPMAYLIHLATEFKSNFIASRMMQQLVVQHLYLHYVSVKDKQRISAILDLPIASQRIMQGQKKLKSIKE